MSTLPYDNTTPLHVDDTAPLGVDNTIDDPRERSPLVLNHHDFGTVTAEILVANESERPPKLWYVTLVISATLAGMLMMLVGYLIITGVGVWGNNSPVMWGCC